MAQLRRLAREVHRRSLLQVLGVYAVASWVIYQVVLALFEGFGLPDWVPPTALVLLLIGLPVVLATAVMQEVAPESGGPREEPGHVPGVAGLETTAETVGAERQRAIAAGATDRAVDPAAAGPTPRPAPGPKRPLFTWSRAITAGVLAFAALGLAASGFMGMRALGIGPAATLMTSGVLDERDRIVMADFRNRTPDSLLSRLVTEALRIDLIESPVVTLVDASYVAEVLQRMQRPPGALDAALAREVAVREGMKAVLEGEVASLGGGYVLTASLVSAESGAALAGFRQTAADSTELIATVDRLSRSIREKVGESLKSVRASKPLSRVTTSSLAALRLYSQGLNEEAIAEDSTFAMAWRSLGVELSNFDIERSRMVEAYTRAYQLRDRLSDRERGLVTAEYFALVAGDHAAAIPVFRRVLATHPDDASALNNLAASLLRTLDPEGAEALLRRAIERWPELGVARMNLVESLLQQGRVDDARAALDAAITALGRGFWVDAAEILLRWDTFEYGRIDALLTEMEGRYGRVPHIRRVIEALRIIAAADRGHLRAAAQHHASHDRLAAAQGWDAQVIASAAVMAQLRLRATGRADLTGLDRLVDEHLEALPALDRPYPALIEAYALAGRADRARGLLTAYDDAVPPDRRGEDRRHEPVLTGLVALAEGRHDDAIGALQEAERRVGPIIHLGDAYERAGRSDSALAAYARLAEGHPPYGIVLAPPGARTHAIWRLARLREEHGAPERAAADYARFLELWRDADPELQSRAEAARRALGRLSGEGP